MVMYVITCSAIIIKIFKTCLKCRGNNICCYSTRSLYSHLHKFWNKLCIFSFQITVKTMFVWTSVFCFIQICSYIYCLNSLSDLHGLITILSRWWCKSCYYIVEYKENIVTPFLRVLKIFCHARNLPILMQCFQ